MLISQLALCNYYTTAPLSFEVLLPNAGNKNWLLESYFYKPVTTTPYTIITILCILFPSPPILQTLCTQYTLKTLLHIRKPQIYFII